MNQLIIGQFIAKKRKEKNLTQSELAEKLGVSNKSVSKWENGRCMPDYSIIESLCKELDITIAELMDGENAVVNSIRTYDEKQTMDLLRRIEELENQRSSMYGILLIIMGIAMNALSQTLGGTDFTNFVSGLLLGLSIGGFLVGLYCIGRQFLKK